MTEVILFCSAVLCAIGILVCVWAWSRKPDPRDVKPRYLDPTILRDEPTYPPVPKGGLDFRPTGKAPSVDRQPEYPPWREKP